MTALLSPLLNEVCVRFTTGSHGVQGTPTVPSDDPYRIVFFVPRSLHQGKEEGARPLLSLGYPTRAEKNRQGHFGGLGKQKWI